MCQRFSMNTTIAALASWVLFALPAYADMALDSSASTVSLVSTKVLADGSKSVSERFRFSELSGKVDDAGNAVVDIDLTSIETGIDIRNERMVEYLFEAVDFPDAQISAMIPADVLQSGAASTEITATVTLHGKSSDITVPVAVHHAQESIYVNAVEPVLFDTNAHDFGTGLGKLAELAGLLHIPTTVPVSFNLTFSK